FTYTVSHDLKSPLFTIRGYIGVLEDLIPGKVSEEVKKYFTYIKTGVDRMQDLLNDLLEISRVGRIEPVFQEVNIDQVIDEAIERVQGQIDAGNIKINRSEINETVTGEKQRLIEVFQNLIDNAIKFMGKQTQPKISIGTEKIHKNTVYYVADNGVGIEEAYRDKVFGLFERLSSDGNGTGVGLAIVKRIIEQHNGKIWVDSEGKDQGSKFYFTINSN
ncbi:MAG: HAMP domain-containing histidine kinase, partial [Calditrichaeota bacterium]|nr:HAMP domain-containing histidine kinase [Calditrichota bacterium]